MRKRVVYGLIVCIMTILLTATTSLADPNLSDIPHHRHWIQTPDGLVQVGPLVCDNPDLQEAFNQFHNNLHIATGSSIGPAAPGLHNFTGAELLASGC
jgi:hypothetical protein